MTEIEEIHDNAFDFLFDKYIEENRQGKEFYFRTRLRFKGKEKLWFLGNIRYAAISFWTGNDYKNKTPNIYFEINIDGWVVLYLVGREDEEKSAFFEELGLKIPGIEKADTAGLWRKVYTERHKGDYLKYLNEFISKDKLIIDEYLETRDSDNIKATIIKDEGLFGDEFSEEFGLYGEPRTKKLEKSSFHNMLSGVLKRKLTSKNYSFHEGEAAFNMPLGLKGLEVRNFRGIKKLKIDGIPIDTKWIVLTGENGYGKTSVLQSIAIGLFGTSDGNFKLMDETSFIGLEGVNSGETLINLSFDYNNDRFYSIGKQLAVYGATRLNIGNSSDQFRPDIGNVTYNLFFTDGTLVNIESELKESFAYDRERFDLLKKAFCQLIPDLSDIWIDKTEKKPVVKYIERDLQGVRYQGVNFEELASGFRNIIGIVGDIVSRFSLNQQVSTLSDLAGIVIIDEIELHLHPKYQKKLPIALSSIFPKIQFIVSTHSPIPLLGMPMETVLLKVSRLNETGIVIERLDVDISNLLPNAILTSPVFGFQDIIPFMHNGGQIMNVSDSYDDIQSQDKIQDKLQEFLSDDKTAELLKLIKKQ